MVRDTFLELDNDCYILCGDFTIASDQTLYTYNYCTVNNPKARVKLLEIMSDLNFVDYYKTLIPENRVYAWRLEESSEAGSP